MMYISMKMETNMMEIFYKNMRNGKGVYTYKNGIKEERIW